MVKWIGPVIGSYNNEVILTDELFKFGVDRGKERRKNEKRKGTISRCGNQNPEEIDILGSLCEIVAVLVMGGYLYVDLSGKDNGYDLVLKDGRKVEVKGKRRKGSYLVIPNGGDISQCDLLCLVTHIEEKRFRFRGWVTLQEFNDNYEELGPNSIPPMREPCTGMDEGELNRLKTLEIPSCPNSFSRVYKGFGWEHFPIEERAA